MTGQAGELPAYTAPCCQAAPATQMELIKTRSLHLSAVSDCFCDSEILSLPAPKIPVNVFLQSAERASMEGGQRTCRRALVMEEEEREGGAAKPCAEHIT